MLYIHGSAESMNSMQHTHILLTLLEQTGPWTHTPPILDLFEERLAVSIGKATIKPSIHRSGLLTSEGRMAAISKLTPCSVFSCFVRYSFLESFARHVGSRHGKRSLSKRCISFRCRLQLPAALSPLNPRSHSPQRTMRSDSLLAVTGCGERL